MELSEEIGSSTDQRGGSDREDPSFKGMEGEKPPRRIDAPDSENGHEDAEGGELCVERRKRKIHFNTLGESGRTAGGSVETLWVVFSHRLRAERVEPFAEGLAVGVKLDGRRPWRTSA
jgi:hypothetical protein